MPICFEGQSVNEIYRQLAAYRHLGQGWSPQSSRNGGTEEVLHVVMTLRSPRERWLTCRRPAINPAFALAEVVWILKGRNDARFLNAFCPGLPRFVGETAEHYGAYGYRLHRHFGVNQLERAYLALKDNPTSRQVVLQIWDVVSDLPDEHGQPKSADIPCNIGAMLKVRDSRLHWTQVMRSTDLFRGLPYNFIQFTFLQELLASWLGLDLGPFELWSDSLHVYDSDSDVLCVLPAGGDDEVSRSRPIILTKDQTEAAVHAVVDRIDHAIDAVSTPRQLLELADWQSDPVFGDILSIMLAELARRRQWWAVVVRLTGHLHDCQLEKVWRAWAERTRMQNP